MTTRIIGDTHGNLRMYKQIIEGCDRSIHVGDFGVGFSNQAWHDKANKLIATGDHHFIRGNHDDPQKCKEMINYVPDGKIINDIMLVGGAWSIDHHIRTEGLNWWSDEEISIKEFDRILEQYAITKPRVMITHDCPNDAAQQLFIDSGASLFPGQPLIKTRTGSYLQAMFEIHQPEQWYFGHWHMTTGKVINGTKFQCLGIHDYVDVEL